ncbi:AsmA family protein, partial [Rhodospirillales bacterium]|nr:AsmA family protein [Rhodospirillales bacterium]
FLSNLDVNLKSRINSLTINGLRSLKITFDSKLNNGNFVLNDFSFKSVAGIQGKISGKLSGLAATPGIPNPVLNDFRINFRGNSLNHSLKILGIKPPLRSLSSGAIRLKAILSGKPNRLKFSANLSMQKGNFYLKGTARPFDKLPSVTGQMKLIHPDLSKLLRTFNISYNPATGKNSRVNLSGKLKASSRSLSLSQITGNLYSLKLGGDLKVKVDKPRPSIIANLATSGINLDNFLPGKTLVYFFKGVNREQALEDVSPSRVFYNTSQSNTKTHKTKTDEIIYVAKKNSGRWSGSPIDISFLKKFDGEFALETPQLKFNKLILKGFKLRANLQNGILKIREATGNLFEGKLKLDGNVTTSNKNSQYQTQFTLNKMNLPLALRALEDRTLKSGTLDLTGNYHTKGRSVVDLVSHLNGSGSFSFNGIDISNRTKGGSAFSSISILLSSLNRFAGVIGGKRGSEKAKLHGFFQVVNGIAKFKNTNLTSGIGNGTANGVVDFPNWRLNATGSLNLSQNILMQALREQAGPKTIPFRISGLLDQPNVKLDTSKFSKSGIRIPGKIGKKIDQILKKKGVGSILQEFLPVSPSISSPRQSSTKRSPQGKPKKNQNAPPSNLKPENILKNILRGLSR